MVQFYPDKLASYLEFIYPLCDAFDQKNSILQQLNDRKQARRRKYSIFYSYINMKSPEPWANQTHNLWITRRELHRCATTIAFGEGNLKMQYCAKN